MSLSRRVGRSVMSQPLYTIKEKRLVLLFSRIVNSLDGLCCSETLIVPWREQSAEKSFDIMIVCLAIARRTHVTYFYSCCLYFFESLKNVRSCCWIIQNNTRTQSQLWRDVRDKLHINKVWDFFLGRGVGWRHKRRRRRITDLTFMWFDFSSIWGFAKKEGRGKKSQRTQGFLQFHAGRQDSFLLLANVALGYHKTLPSRKKKTIALRLCLAKQLINNQTREIGYLNKRLLRVEKHSGVLFQGRFGSGLSSYRHSLDDRVQRRN